MPEARGREAGNQSYPASRWRVWPVFPRAGFTLIELLTVIVIVGLLFGLLVTQVLPRATEMGRMAQSASNLRQLGIATHLYLNEHEDRFFPFSEPTPDGTLWYFGLEPRGGPKAEGERELDSSRSPLFPYLEQIGGVEICPGFDYENALWKPKFKGASWGYGYNIHLGPMFRPDGTIRNGLVGKTYQELTSPSHVILFGTCAQINTMQAPASPSNPMIEEFYIIDDTHRTIHFRFGGGQKALFVFADGHVDFLSPYPGQMDNRLPSANVGRISPRLSTLHLE